MRFLYKGLLGELYLRGYNKSYNWESYGGSLCIRWDINKRTNPINECEKERNCDLMFEVLRVLKDVRDGDLVVSIMRRLIYKQ